MGTYKSSKKQVKRYKRSYRKKIKKSAKKTRKSVKRIKRSYLRNSKKKENKQKGGGLKDEINLLCKIPIDTLKYIFEQMSTNPDQWEYIFEQMSTNPDQWEYIFEQMSTNPTIFKKNLKVIRLLLELDTDGKSRAETELKDLLLYPEHVKLITAVINGTLLPSVAGGGAARSPAQASAGGLPLAASVPVGQPPDSALGTDPSKCIQCRVRPKYTGSNFCGNMCKKKYLDETLQCLTCGRTPMGKLSPQGDMYNIDSLFCRECRCVGPGRYGRSNCEAKDIKWKRSVNSIGGMYNGTPAITILQNKGWLPNEHIGEVSFALGEYRKWMNE